MHNSFQIKASICHLALLGFFYIAHVNTQLPDLIGFFKYGHVVLEKYLSFRRKFKDQWKCFCLSLVHVPSNEFRVLPHNLVSVNIILLFTQNIRRQCKRKQYIYRLYVSWDIHLLERTTYLKNFMLANCNLMSINNFYIRKF